MDVFRSEIRSGLVILVAGILLTIGIFIVGGTQFWEDKKTIVLHFPAVDGISKGSPVWYAGLEVGEVSALRIIPGKTDRIELTVQIDLDVPVSTDSKAYIRNLGMMGAKYVEITPGETGEELADQGILEGQDPTSLGEVFEKMDNIAEQLNETIPDVQTLVNKIHGEVSLQETVQNANALLVEMRQRGEDLGNVLHKADALLITSKDSVEGLTESLDGTTRAIKKVAETGGKELVALLRELRDTNRELKVRIVHLDEQLDPVLAQAHRDLREAGGLIRDVRAVVDANDQNLYLLILHLKEASRHLDSLSKDLRAHPWKVVWKGRGSVDGGNRSGPDGWPHAHSTSPLISIEE